MQRSTAPADRPAAARTARSQVGGDLVREVNLRLTPSAWATIAGGDADARILRALAELTVRQGHRIDVSDLPRSTADRRALLPARTVVVTAFDGIPVAGSDPRVAEVRRLLAGLGPPYRPDSVAVGEVGGRPALTISYRSSTSTGLVPQLGPS